MNFIQIIESLDSNKKKVILIFSFIIAIFIWAIFFFYMIGVPLSGDENVYHRNAAALASFVMGDGKSQSEIIAQLVGFGWFMPGPSVVLTPLLIAAPEPGLVAIRAYATLFNMALWLWALRSLYRAIGPRYALGLLIFPTLAVTWQMFSSTIWGDLPAGLLAVIVFAYTYRLSLEILGDQSLKICDMVALALTMTFMIYMRGSTYILAASVIIYLISLCIIRNRGRRALHNVALVGSTFLVIGALVAPWSLSASRILGSPVFTTSTVALSVGLTFGKTENFCFGPCPEGNIWYKSAGFARQLSRETGKSELEIQEEMTRSALADLQLRDYLNQVRKNFTTYAFSPHGFNGRFVNSNDFVTQSHRISILENFRIINNSLYFMFFYLSLIGVLSICKEIAENQVLSLIAKMFILTFLIQPFVHPSHSRYWVTFAPLMAVGAIFALSLIYEIFTSQKLQKAVGTKTQLLQIDQWQRILFTCLQALFSVAFIIFVVVIF